MPGNGGRTPCVDDRTSPLTRTRGARSTCKTGLSISPRSHRRRGPAKHSARVSISTTARASPSRLPRHARSDRCPQTEQSVQADGHTGGAAAFRRPQPSGGVSGWSNCPCAASTSSSAKANWTCAVMRRDSHLAPGQTLTAILARPERPAAACSPAPNLHLCKWSPRGRRLWRTRTAYERTLDQCAAGK